MKFLCYTSTSPISGMEASVMYGILIVDDNSLVRMSLVSLINWKRHNATLVAIAHDGNEAFRLCEEHLPHIVITDIKMPGCDGITLMKKIRRDYPMIQIIAISAHGVFEYAKQAMQAGCLNYILKPISGEELNESIASAIAVIQSRGGRTDEELYNLYEYALNSFLSSAEKYCAAFLAGWELPTAEEIESVCTIKYSGQILKAPTQYFQTFLLIFEQNDVSDSLKKVTNVLAVRNGCKYVIESIPEAVLIDEVGSYFVSIKKKVALMAFWAGNLIVSDERLILEKLEDEVKIYWSLIDYRGMANALKKRLSRKDIRDFSAMRKNKKLIEDYLRLLMTLSLSRSDEVCELMLNIRNQEKCFHYKDIVQVLGDVEQLLLLICEDAAKQKQDDIGMSWKVRRMIDINYPSPINLSMLSSILAYSPSYIDRSFRKTFGVSVNQYLIQTRLKAAQSLLWSTSRKVRDISESVGYSDYFNFAKQFRKQFGLTPTEYRAQRERDKT